MSFFGDIYGGKAAMAAAKYATGYMADDFFSLVSGCVRPRNFLEGLLRKGEVSGDWEG